MLSSQTAGVVEDACNDTSSASPQLADYAARPTAARASKRTLNLPPWLRCRSCKTPAGSSLPHAAKKTSGTTMAETTCDASCAGALAADAWDNAAVGDSLSTELALAACKASEIRADHCLSHDDASTHVSQECPSDSGTELAP